MITSWNLNYYYILPTKYTDIKFNFTNIVSTNYSTKIILMI